MTLDPRWPEFEALKSLTGPAYVEARDRVLATPGLVSRLRACLKSTTDAQSYFQARILHGWLLHHSLYAQVLQTLVSAALKSEVEVMRLKRASIDPLLRDYRLKAKTEYRTRISALCWEDILKGTSEHAWQRAVFEVMLEEVPVVEDIEPALALVMNSEDPLLHEVASDYLGRMPASVIVPRLNQDIATLATRMIRSDDYPRLARQRRALIEILARVKEHHRPRQP